MSLLAKLDDLTDAIRTAVPAADAAALEQDVAQLREKLEQVQRNCEPPVASPEAGPVASTATETE
jgi:hypothetical protein